jgi:hypothetical protein
MDIIPTGDAGPQPERRLGRDTELTMATKPHWETLIPEAPRVFANTSDSVEASPPIWRYCPGGFQNQWIGMCFPAGTPVRTADGNEKPIEEIAVGDRVVTHAAGDRRVLGTFSRKYTGELVTLTPAGFPFPLSATRDHLFAVPVGDSIRWVAAGELQPGDRVLVGDRSPASTCNELDVLSFVDGAYSTHDLLEGRPTPLRKPAVAAAAMKRAGLDQEPDRVRNSVLRRVPVTPALGRLAGTYLAEGSIDDASSRVIWSLHLKEEALANEIVQLVRGCFGVEAYHDFANNGAQTRFVKVDNATFARFWRALFPGDVASKRVPGFLMGAAAAVRRAVIAGWMAGDGHHRVRKAHRGHSVVMTGVSVSRGMVRDMLTLAASLRICASGRSRRPRPDRRQAFDVDLSGKRAVSLDSQFEAEVARCGVRVHADAPSKFHRFGRIVTLKTVDRTYVENLPVYDFEVEEDHSFIAAGIVVHNCVGCGTANGAATVIRIPEHCVFDPADPSKSTPPLPTRRLSGLFSYWNARNVRGSQGRPWGEGAVVAYSLEGLMRWGVIPEELWPDTQANQAAFSDGRAPGDAMRAEGAKHVVLDARRITSKGMYFDYLAQGFPIIDGVSISRGWTSTREDGYFALGGAGIGGHCTLTVGYDRRKNRLYKRNSWMQWGARTSDPEFAGQAQGFSNIGYCDLDQYERYYLGDDKLASGETDAFVINDVPGFEKPKIQFISATELFT